MTALRDRAQGQWVLQVPPWRAGGGGLGLPAFIPASMPIVFIHHGHEIAALDHACGIAGIGAAIKRTRVSHSSGRATAARSQKRPSKTGLGTRRKTFQGYGLSGIAATEVLSQSAIFTSLRSHRHRLRLGRGRRAITSAAMGYSSISRSAIAAAGTTVPMICTADRISSISTCERRGLHSSFASASNPLTI